MGKIELDHTGSGGGVTLSSDGTDLLLDGTAVGGAALELYAENPSSPTAPSATGTNAVAIGNGTVASGLNSFASGFSADATNSNAIAIGQNAQSTGSSSLAIGKTTSASSSQGSAIGSGSGGVGAVATVGAGAMALGCSRASGTDSFAAAIASNSSSYGATGANSVAIGQNSKATGTGSVALGYGSVSSNIYSVSIGKATSATAISSVSIGSDSKATATAAIALGSSAYAYNYNQFAFGSGDFGPDGSAQASKYILRRSSVDATPVVLTANNSTPNTTNQIILLNNSAHAFHGTIVARQQASAGTASAAWKVEGLIRREGSAGTTVLVNSATTVLDNTPSWGLALSADTTNGGLKIEAIGAASTNIRWVATIHTSEVTYA